MNDFFQLKKKTQLRTIEELIARSQPSPIYQVLLILSTIIIASGILLNQIAVIIGGMLVTPVLSPLILFGLATSIGNYELLRKTAINLGKSFLYILLTTIIFTILVGPSKFQYLPENTSRTALLYFIISLIAGMATSFSWALPGSYEILSAMAITVSIVPPLVLSGIHLTMFDFGSTRFSILIFILNVIGVIVGSLIVFSLFKFYKISEKVDEIQESVETKSTSSS